MAVDNLPIIFLFIIGLGIVVIVASVISLAGIHETSKDYYITNGNTDKSEDTAHLQELFSYFLQEEEKKNEKFRQMVLDTSNQQMMSRKSASEGNRAATKKEAMDQKTFNEIIRRYDEGEDIQSIAKSLKKGIGEVKLIISLYSMR